jgi:hypothetical protein
LIKIDQAGEAKNFLKIKSEDRRTVRSLSHMAGRYKEVEVRVQQWGREGNNGEEWEFVGKGAKVLGELQNQGAGKYN